MWVLLRQRGRLLRIATAGACIWIVIAIAYSGCRQQNAEQCTPPAQPQSPQESPDSVHRNQQKANDAQEKKECIQWLIEHKVIVGLFFDMDPERKENPIRWHEKYFDKFWIASLDDETIRDEDVHYLSLIPNLGVICLDTDTTRISEAGLRHLKSCPHLDSVSITGSREVPKTWVEMLASLGTVEVWCLLAPVTSDSIGVLRDSDIARRVRLGNATSLTESGYGVLATLPNLEELYIIAMRSVGDTELNPITRCTKLRKLDITVFRGELEISAAFAEKIVSLPEIDSLYLGYSEPALPLPNEVLATLGKGKCKKITLYHPTVRDRAVKEGKDVDEVSRQMIDEATAAVSGSRANARDAPTTSPTDKNKPTKDSPN